MRISQPGEGPSRRSPDYAELVERFPGPVAIACVPPAGSIAMCGYETSDGHPWAVEVTYALDGRDLLRVRTVRGSIDWTEAVRGTESLAGNLGLLGLPGEPEAPETSTSVTVDGTAVAGTRIDLPDLSGVRLEWRGQHVFCIGDPRRIDTVELRSASGADFARLCAEFEDFVARRRAERGY